VSYGRFHQLVGVIGCCLPKAAPHDHSISVACATVTGRAINVESFLAAKQIYSGNRERKVGNILSILFARVTSLVNAQVAARDRTFDGGSLGSSIAKELSCGKGFIARLIVHILAAG
jgi:hypothetical protein